MDPNRIIAEINQNGILRNNKFRFRVVPLPIALSRLVQEDDRRLMDGGQSGGNVLELYGEMTTLPGVQLATQEVRRYGYGPIEKKPYVPVFNDHTVMFRSDAAGIIWAFLHDWARLAISYQAPQGMNDENNNTSRDQRPYEVGYKRDYAVQGQITIFDDHGYPAIDLVMRDIYPIAVADVPLNWGAQNEYLKIPVVLSYFDWYRTTPNLSRPASPQRIEK